MKLDKEIETAIKKNLPELAAGELKKFIEDAKKVALEKEALEYSNKQLYEAKDELWDRINKLEALGRSEEVLKSQQDAIKVRELDLEGRERNLELKMLEIRLIAAEDSKRDIYNLVDRLFRNTEFRQSTFGRDEKIGTIRDYNGDATSTILPTNYNEEKTQFTE